MAANRKILDAKGRGHGIRVNEEGTIGVVAHPHPPVAEVISVIPVREYFKDSSGAFDMTVDGSSTNEIFTIDADPDFDVYIKTISFELTGSGGSLNEFGTISALSNGCELLWSTSDLGEVVLHEALQSNWNIVRLCVGNPAFGSAASSFRANNVSGTAEGFIPVLNIENVFGIQYGFRLRKGSKDSIKLIIKDDLTSVTSFDVIAYGQKL